MGYKSYLECWGIPTLLPLEEVQQFAVRLWASRVEKSLDKMEITKHKFVTTKFNSTSKSASSNKTFYSWLNKGYPAPTLKIAGETKPFLLQLDDLVPGSFRDLAHPVFVLLSGPTSLPHVGRLMHACPISVHRFFFVFCEILENSRDYEDQYFVHIPPSARTLATLHELGGCPGLDGFAGVICWVLLMHIQRKGTISPEMQMQVEVAVRLCLKDFSEELKEIGVLKLRALQVALAKSTAEEESSNDDFYREIAALQLAASKSQMAFEKAMLENVFVRCSYADISIRLASLLKTDVELSGLTTHFNDIASALFFPPAILADCHVDIAKKYGNKLS